MPYGTLFSLLWKFAYIDLSYRAPLAEPTPESNNIIKRDEVSLADLWSSVPKTQSVGVGDAHLYTYSAGSSAFTTAEFYGCTVVIVIDGRRTMIGHFNQEQGNCADVLTSSDVTEESILTRIADELNVDFETTAKAWIIASTPNAVNSPGYKDIVELLKAFDVQEDNITSVPYSASSGVGGFPGLARGKAVVTRDENSDGSSIVNLYICGQRGKLFPHHQLHQASRSCNGAGRLVSCPRRYSDLYSALSCHIVGNRSSLSVCDRHINYNLPDGRRRHQSHRLQGL